MHDQVGKQKNASIKNISASSKYQVIIGLHTKRTHMFTGGINSLHTNAHYSNPMRTLPPRTWSRPNEETSLLVLNLPENQAANSSLNARSFGALFIGWLKSLYATSMRYRATSSCKNEWKKLSKYDTNYSCVAWVLKKRKVDCNKMTKKLPDWTLSLTSHQSSPHIWARKSHNHICEIKKCILHSSDA